MFFIFSGSINANEKSITVTPISVEDYKKENRELATRKEGPKEEYLQSLLVQNKSDFYKLYNRALRKNPNLKGKIVIELIITEDGEIYEARIVSSSLPDKKLEAKLIGRANLMRFGKIDSAVKVRRPLSFLPY